MPLSQASSDQGRAPATELILAYLKTGKGTWWQGSRFFLYH